MFKIFIIISLILSFTLYANPRYPFPTHMHYYEASSIKSISHTKQIEYIKRYYDQFKDNFFVKDKDGYRVANDKKDKRYTVSEGQGYGMMIIALMAGYDKDAKFIFDSMLNFAKSHPSSINKNFMSWKVPTKKGDNDSAVDGDCDIAYALLLADKQWGSKGDINYKKEALKIIDALINSAVGEDSYLPLLGDWVEMNGKKYNQYTVRTSDFMLSHFKAFYRVSKDKRWLKVVKSCQNALKDIQALKSNGSKLVSDFIFYDKKSKHFKPTKRNFLEENDDSFSYNACRVPLRVAMDALFNNDAISKKISMDMLKWIYTNSSKNPTHIYPGYRLSGKPIATDYHSVIFIAPFGVVSKLDREYQDYLEQIFSLSVKSHENYFEDSITLISLLVMIDAFWDPTLVE